MLDFDQAEKLLLEAYEGGDTSRKVRYGLGIIGLNVHPRTEKRLERCRAFFEGLIADDANDEYGLASSYYLARIKHTHLRVPQFEEALALYDTLVARAPSSFWGQLARLKSATIRLHQPLSAAQRREVLDQLHHALDVIEEPALRRNYLATLAEAIQLYDLDAALAAQYYQEAVEIGFDRRRSQSYMLLRLGHEAEEAGRLQQAVAAWKALYTHFPTHSKAFMLKQRVQALEEQAL